MRLQVIGIEGSKGISKAGKAYEIGQIHTIIRLAPPLGENNVAQGFMGSTYSAPLEVIAQLKAIPAPFYAEADVQDVMRFGKREQMVIGVVPEKAKA